MSVEENPFEWSLREFHFDRSGKALANDESCISMTIKVHYKPQSFGKIPRLIVLMATRERTIFLFRLKMKERRQYICMTMTETRDDESLLSFRIPSSLSRKDVLINSMKPKSTHTHFWEIINKVKNVFVKMKSDTWSYLDDEKLNWTLDVQLPWQLIF